VTSSDRRVLIVGIDGLRPDLFDPDAMPTLARFVQQGVSATQYHSIYPTHTRAINTTLATGCTPGKHGWMANVYRYEGVTEDGIINTADAAQIQAMDDATGLNAIKVPTLGDLLARYGKKVGVASTQSSGASLIWTRKQQYPVATVSTTYGRADNQQVWDQVGTPPGIDEPKPGKSGQSHWAKRVVIDCYLDDPDVAVIYFYMVEPDFSLHYYGLGAPEVTEALTECDRALAEVLDAMEQRGIRDQFDLIVLSDHGHSTTKVSRSLTEHLDRARTALGPDIPALTTASDYIYPAKGNPMPTAREIAPVVRWLQERPWTGAVFAHAQYADLPGVLPLSAAWNGHDAERSPLLAISPAWSDAPNENGVPGMLAALTEHAALRSTHGSCSPFEMHAFWSASGPSFLESTKSDLPAGGTDLLPTVLTLLGIPVPGWIDGRPMQETLRQPTGAVESTSDEVIEPLTAHADGFNPALHLHRVGHTTYIHQAANGNPDSAPAGE
jgi:arylsulfatase A-like enzyme